MPAREAQRIATVELPPLAPVVEVGQRRGAKVYVHTEEGKVKAEAVLARYPFAFAVSLEDATVSSRNASFPECTSEEIHLSPGKRS